MIEGMEDTTPPVLTGFTLSASTADTSAGPVAVTVTVSCTDDLSGIAGATVYARAPAGAGRFVSGSSQSGGGAGVLSCSLSVSLTWPQYSVGGGWPLSLVLTDTVGNTANYSYAQLVTAGYAAAVTLS